MTKWDIWNSCATGSRYLFEIKTSSTLDAFSTNMVDAIPWRERNHSTVAVLDAGPVPLS